MNPNRPSSDERLWTPWRMSYISGDAKEDGCIFCNRFAAMDDVTSLILHRAQHSFVIMNLFPYNTGHVMLVPIHHASDPEDLDVATLREMGEMLPLLTRCLRRVFNCAGFNVGLNIGAVAGAGVASHLHQHIVPRWQGDANFLPILASTMAIPELIPSTYAKVRAELHRNLAQSRSCGIVLLSARDDLVLTHRGHLPRVELVADRSVWQQAISQLPDTVTNIEIAGWAGTNRANSAPEGSPAITLRGELRDDLSEEWRFVPIGGGELAHDDRETIARALDQLAPAIGRSHV
jgi:ATP adenylyltransferase